MSSNNDERHIKMEVYLQMIITILKKKPQFITTIPKEGAMKLLLLLEVEGGDNSDLSEKLIHELIDKHGISFLDELEAAINDPISLIGKIDDDDE